MEAGGSANDSDIGEAEESKPEHHLSNLWECA